MGIVVGEIKSMNSNRKSVRYVHVPVQNEILDIITIYQWVMKWTLVVQFDSCMLFFFLLKDELNKNFVLFIPCIF
jgi:hypothetical protein